MSDGNPVMATSDRHARDPIRELAAKIWIDWPRRIIRRLPGARGIAGDGHFLVTAPPLAVLAPVATILTFFVIGVLQRGYEVVYTESLFLMAAIIAVGCLSGTLGVLAVTSFAIADFVFGNAAAIGVTTVTGLESLWQVRLPMIITYLLLALVVVIVPRTARGLVIAVGRWRRLPAVLAWPIASLLVLVVTWIGTSTWAAIAPTLIRPRFVWPGGQPTVAAIAPLQTQAATLIAAAVIATIVRQLWIGATMVDGPLQRSLARAEARPAPVRPAPTNVTTAAPTSDGAGARQVSALRRGAADVISAALATLVLAGVLQHAWLWVAAFGVFLTIRLLRSGVISPPVVDAHKRLAQRMPAVFRLLTLWLLARVVANFLSNGAISSYTGLALFVIVGTAIIYGIFPGPPTTPPPDPPPPDAVPRDAAPPTAASAAA